MAATSLTAWTKTPSSSGSSVAISSAPSVEGHVKLHVGFDLTLAAPRPRDCMGDPGCPACIGVWEGLKELALGVLPPGIHHQVEPFDAAFHFERQAHWEPEILLVVEIIPEGTFEPVNGAMRRSADAVRARLRRLEVQERLSTTR